MRPELFKLPFVNITIKSYGAMMVVGFLCALYLARWRARKLKENPLNIANFAVYILLAGVVGARIMHVIHNFSDYRDNLWEVLMVWRGGLEFIGGVICATLVMVIYSRRMKLPVLKYLDILAPAVMLGLAFGRIGCLLNGCCFGQPSNLPWAIRFPALNTHITQNGPELRYSIPYLYQLTPDEQRPDIPKLDDVLTPDFYEYYYIRPDQRFLNVDYFSKDDLSPEELKNCSLTRPKPLSQLTEEQIQDLKNNKYPMHKIHPAQIYSSLNALVLCLFLNFLFKFYKFPGQIIAYMLIFYGITRFLLEMLRCEPFLIDSLTASQAIGILAVVVGVILLLFMSRRSKVQISQS
jgi:phosphatidylglycerol:prolipoprotein diacylglycerol transferase